jgi:hypothetical protein
VEQKGLWAVMPRKNKGKRRKGVLKDVYVHVRVPRPWLAILDSVARKRRTTRAKLLSRILRAIGKGASAFALWLQSEF